MRLWGVRPAEVAAAGLLWYLSVALAVGVVLGVVVLAALLVRRFARRRQRPAAPEDRP
jgi:membrane protein implicated in regulation of membrane protease activity